MQMAIASDGGIVTRPFQWFEENKSAYRLIESRLETTRQAYLDADRENRLHLLFNSATYGLLTANAPLYQADSAFQAYLGHTPPFDQESLADSLKGAGIGYYNNRSTYIADNYWQIDEIFYPTDDAVRSGNLIEAQDTLMKAKGLGPAKSAFTLAMLGFTDMACLDTNVCQQLNIDPRDYDKHNATQYQQMVDDAFAQLPALRAEASPFLTQWVLFDCNRGSVETHDDWFDHVDSILEPESISAPGVKE